MHKNSYYGALIIGAVVTLMLAVTLTLSLSRFHRRPNPPVNSPMVAQAIRSTGESRGGQKESIKVHGHWTIDVRNADGTLATHREFENALQTSGAKVLAHLLARLDTVQPDRWSIRIGEGASGSGPCATPDPAYCEIMESTYPGGLPPRYFKTLTLSVNEAAASFVLNGTATAQRASQIDNLSTFVGECSQGSCNSGLLFTHVDLPAPVNGSCSPNIQCAVSVVSGQIIQVSVTISFS
jgi:hypothetical protein